VATPMRPSVAVARSAAWAAARGSGDPTTTPAETALPRRRRLCKQTRNTLDIPRWRKTTYP
jgi:hypothetical protein